MFKLIKTVYIYLQTKYRSVSRSFLSSHNVTKDGVVSWCLPASPWFMWQLLNLPYGVKIPTPLSSTHVENPAAPVRHLNWSNARGMSGGGCWCFYVEARAGMVKRLRMVAIYLKISPNSFQHDKTRHHWILIFFSVINKNMQMTHYRRIQFLLLKVFFSISGCWLDTKFKLLIWAVCHPLLTQISTFTSTLETSKVRIGNFLVFCPIRCYVWNKQNSCFV